MAAGKQTNQTSNEPDANKELADVRAEITKLQDQVNTLTSENNKLKQTNKTQAETISRLTDGKEARGEAVATNVPDWKKLNYNGPMTVEIATFRNQRMVSKTTEDGDVMACAEGFMECPDTGAVIPAPAKPEAGAE